MYLHVFMTLLIYLYIISSKMYSAFGILFSVVCDLVKIYDSQSTIYHRSDIFTPTCVISALYKKNFQDFSRLKKIEVQNIVCVKVNDLRIFGQDTIARNLQGVAEQVSRRRYRKFVDGIVVEQPKIKSRVPSKRTERASKSVFATDATRNSTTDCHHCAARYRSSINVTGTDKAGTSAWFSTRFIR